MGTYEVVYHPSETTSRSTNPEGSRVPSNAHHANPSHSRIRHRRLRFIIGGLLGQLKPKSPNRDFDPVATSAQIDKRINAR